MGPIPVIPLWDIDEYSSYWVADRICCGGAKGDLQGIVRLVDCGWTDPYREGSRDCDLPVRLRFIEVPLDRGGNVSRNLRALDSGIIEMIFKVKRKLSSEKRRIRFRTRTTQ
jgi:hypothetical protein